MGARALWLSGASGQVIVENDIRTVFLMMIHMGLEANFSLTKMSKDFVLAKLLDLM